MIKYIIIYLFLAIYTFASELPNIVLILADDLGWTDTSYQGSDLYQTPNLDAMAEQSAVYTEAYAAGPVCSPSRAAIMTGKTPARLWLTTAITRRNLQNTQPGPGKSAPANSPLINPIIRNHLPLSEITIAEHLKTAGYTTALYGKWHLRMDGETEFGPDAQGFDVCEMPGNEAWSNYFKPFKGQPHQNRTGTYLTEQLTTRAVGFIKKHRKKPFFLMLSHYAVHDPLQAREEVVDSYRAKAESSNNHKNPTYAAMIQALDDSCGRILRAIEANGLSENTLVIFTSDNGGLLKTREQLVTQNAPLQGGKGSIYEGGLRVPFYAYWPSHITPKVDTKSLISSCDLLPTILAAANIKAKPYDGVDLLPSLLTTAPLDPTRPLYFHLPHWRSQSSAIRKDKWKLIYWYENDEVELFNLEEDIAEKYNLADSLPETAKSLKQQLMQYLKSVDAQMPRENPAYNQHP
ncbi:sulfatase [Coraliomargarita sp. W4R53]